MPLAWAGDAREIEESEHDKRANWLNARAEDVARLLQNRSIASAVVYHRVKSPDSAKEKALRRGSAITDLNDLYGMRVVVQNELDVYRCLDAICTSYNVVNGTLKNYIANPKPPVSKASSSARHSWQPLLPEKHWHASSTVLEYSSFEHEIIFHYSTP